MTREELARELRALPPEKAAAMLRQLLDRQDAQELSPEDWRAIARRVIAQHRVAWERLAQR